MNFFFVVNCFFLTGIVRPMFCYCFSESKNSVLRYNQRNLWVLYALLQANQYVLRHN